MQQFAAQPEFALFICKHPDAVVVELLVKIFELFRGLMREQCEFSSCSFVCHGKHQLFVFAAESEPAPAPFEGARVNVRRSSIALSNVMQIRRVFVKGTPDSVTHRRLILKMLHLR